MLIEDGSGHGYKAAVTADNKLMVLAETISSQAHASIAHGQAFQATSGERVIATAGAEGLLAIKNDNDAKTLLVTCIRMGLDEVETVGAKFEVLMDGTWVAGTAAPEPVNMNLGSAAAAGVDADIDTLPTGSAVSDVRWLKGPDEVVYRKEGALIIPPGKHFALKVTTQTNGATCWARVSFMLVDQTVAQNRF